MDILGRCTITFHKNKFQDESEITYVDAKYLNLEGKIWLHSNNFRLLKAKETNVINADL